jgi:hypothetical protein
MFALIDESLDDILFISTDSSLLEECIMDEFFEQYQQQCQAAVDEHFIDMIHITEDTGIMLQDEWDMLMRWFNDNYFIREVPVI